MALSFITFACSKADKEMESNKLLPPVCKKVPK